MMTATTVKAFPHLLLNITTNILVSAKLTNPIKLYREFETNDICGQKNILIKPNLISRFYQCHLHLLRRNVIIANIT